MTTTSQAGRVYGPRSSLNLQDSNRSKSEKVMYRLTLVALAFFLVLPASAAHAQLPEIVQQFCTDAGQATDDFLGELSNAAREVKDCFGDFDDCTSGRGESGCLGDFRRCSERANTDQDQACSDFQREFRDAFDDGLGVARQQGLGDDYLTDDTVQGKVDIAQSFGGLCGAPPDEPPAPGPDTVCETALCSDNGSPARAEECGSAVDACKEYSGEDLETCVSLGLFICRGGVLPEDPPPAPPAPDDPPSPELDLCDTNLCALSETQAQICREFFFSCALDPSSTIDDGCVGAALLFCKGGL